MAGTERSGFSEFDRLLELVRSTRLVLHSLLGAGELPVGGAEFLAQATLPHVEAIEAGVRGWLRSEMAGTAEQRFLILQTPESRVARPATPAEALAAAFERERERIRRAELGSRIAPADAFTMVALAHARLVFASMPGLPSAEVRFPAGRPTYADIPTPRGPAELVERIEELERELWRIASGRPVRRVDPAVRRTYGFFDTAEWLDRRTFPPPA